MSLSKDEVLHVARLARLGLTDGEVESMQGQLSMILDQFDVLRRLDTDNVPPTAQVFANTNVFREDDPVPSSPVEEILRNAPLREGDYLRVRAVLDE